MMLLYPARNATSIVPGVWGVFFVVSPAQRIVLYREYVETVLN